jgi:hypothetical protein
MQDGKDATAADDLTRPAYAGWEVSKFVAETLRQPVACGQPFFNFRPKSHLKSQQNL